MSPQHDDQPTSNPRCPVCGQHRQTPGDKLAIAIASVIVLVFVALVLYWPIRLASNLYLDLFLRP